MAAPAKFEEREIVWATVTGWPPWPAVIEQVLETAAGRFEYRLELLGPSGQLNSAEAERTLKPWAAAKPREVLLPRFNSVYSAKEQAEYRAAVAEAYERGQPKVEVDHTCCYCRAPPDEADDQNILVCDGCEKGYHLNCLALASEPENDEWFCAACKPRESPVVAVVGAAIANVLARCRPLAIPPIPPSPIAAELDLVQLLVVPQSSGASESPVLREARVVSRDLGLTANGKPGTWIECDAPEAPVGAPEYRTRDNETLAGIIGALYSDDKACAEAVEEVILAFQKLPLVSSSIRNRTSLSVRLDKLAVRTQVALPELHVTSRRNETPCAIARRYGRRDVDTLIALNKTRSRTLANAANLTASSQLQIGTVVILPPAMPDARSPKPLICSRT